MTGAGLARADAVRLPFRSGSVHLSISSPPYFALRSYQDGGEHYAGQIGSEAGPVDFLRANWAVADEVHRVLADDGSAWWNLGDKYSRPGGGVGKSRSLAGAGAGAGTEGRRLPTSTASVDVREKSLMGLPWRFAMGLIRPDLYRAPFEPAACWHDDGPGPCRTCPPRSFPQWVGRAEVIWSKPNGLPESVTDRPRRSHEQWFMVTKQPRYFAAVDEVRETYTAGTAERYALGYNRTGASAAGQTLHGVLRKDNGGPASTNPLGKLPGSVRSVPSEPLRVPEFFVSDDGMHWRTFAPPASGHGQQEVRRRLWDLSTERAAAGRALHVASVDHFAAFPSEWPRWIIVGWSPRGICTACGQGRRPVVAKALAVRSRNVAPRRYAEDPNGQTPGDYYAGIEFQGSTSATITGYACACPDDTAPTRPAVVLDPFAGTGTVPMMARAMGRFGVGVDLSRDYLRLARWRVFESGHGEKRLAKAGKRPPRPRKVRRPAPPMQAALFEVVAGG